MVISSPLRIVVAGVPPGVKVGVFDETESPGGSPADAIMLVEAESDDYVVAQEVPASLAGRDVRLVIRSAGFLPITAFAKIDPQHGLLHAARLEVDHNYSGSQSEVPDDWNADAENRKAQDFLHTQLVAAVTLGLDSRTITDREFKSVFISFGEPDEGFAQKLQRSLEAEGVDTYFFPLDATPGDKLHRVIRSGVNDYDRVVLICSRASLDRPGVLNEIEEALAREAREGGSTVLIPIRLDDYVLGEWAPENPDIAQAIRDRVVADFRDTEDDQAFALALGRLLGSLEQMDRSGT